LIFGVAARTLAEANHQAFSLAFVVAFVLCNTANTSTRKVNPLYLTLAATILFAKKLVAQR